MRNKSFFLLIILIICACSHEAKVQDLNFCQQVKSKYESLGKPSKIIFVTSKDWKSTLANLEMWEMNKTFNWTKKGADKEVMIGKAGLALGLDWYHLAKRYKFPLKKEGDGKTPFGFYLLGSKFGKLPGQDFKQDENYILLNPGTECVDDVNSPYYNRIVETTLGNSIAQKQWNSSEKMFDEPLYQQGISINYSTRAASKSGSCIFLHLRDETKFGTAGCIATNKKHMDKIYQFALNFEPVMIAIITESFYPTVQECLLVN